MSNVITKHPDLMALELKPAVRDLLELLSVVDVHPAHIGSAFQERDHFGLVAGF